MRINPKNYYTSFQGVKYCKYREEGICTYWKTLEEQYEDEENGLPAYYCDGLEKDMEECGLEEEEEEEEDDV